jgi:putative phosphoesterase
MKIGVISDTHIPYAASQLPSKIYEDFKNVDLILHAGDLVDISVLEELKKMADVQAVHGNMDAPKVFKLLPEKKIINIGTHSIGLTHGHGPPFNLIHRVREEFTQKVDVIVFGHSHSPVNKIQDGILFFNPGSPTDRVFAKHNSYGILTVNKGIKGEIVRLR